LEFYPLQVNLSQGILLLESLPCDSIELVNRANEDNRCVSCVCVFAFDLFIVFIRVPRHKSHESIKIGPHPRGHPSSYGIRSFWLPRIYSCFLFPPSISKIQKIAPKLPRILISRFVEFFVVLIHRFDVLGVDLYFHKLSSPNSLYFGRNR
jgi:hypothetical protein